MKSRIAVLALVVVSVLGACQKDGEKKSGGSVEPAAEVSSTTTSTTAAPATTTSAPSTSTTAKSVTTTSRPATATPTSSAGAGATAVCNDGTYSYAATHQGACSRHGGVAQFYK